MLERVPFHIPHDTGCSQEKLVKPPCPAVPEITRSRDRGHQPFVLAFLCESQQLPTSLEHIFHSDMWQPLFSFLWIPLIQIPFLRFSHLQLSCYSPNLLCPFLLSGYGTLSMLNSCQSNLQSRGLSWEHSSVFCCFRLQELSIWNLYFGVCEGLTLEMALSEGPSLTHPCTGGCYLKAFQNSLEKMKKINWRNLEQSQHLNAMK